jgi:hypothetical protein
MLQDKATNLKNEGLISNFSPEEYGSNGSPSKLDLRTSDMGLSSSSINKSESKKHV